MLTLKLMPIALPDNYRELLRALGSYGGRVRAQKYSKEQLSEWGKRGGRPKKQRSRSRKNRAAASSPRLAADNPPIDSSKLE